MPLPGAAILSTLGDPSHLHNEKDGVGRVSNSWRPRAESGPYIYRCAPTFKNRPDLRLLIKKKKMEVLAFLHGDIRLKLSSVHPSDGPAPLDSHGAMHAAHLTLEAPEFAILILELRS